MLSLSGAGLPCRGSWHTNHFSTIIASQRSESYTKYKVSKETLPETNEGFLQRMVRVPAKAEPN
jgi:hypothetical protein